jgi:quercetin dioxygenase-like cupin family protein
MLVVPPYLPRQNGGTISFHLLRQRWYLEMMTVKTCSALIFSFSTLFMAQEASAPVPVENEPLHHVVLRNESVVVIHLVLPPGERTLYHIHTHDRIAIPLSSTSITQQVLNEREGSPSLSEAGTFSALTLPGSSYTHRVHNVGGNPYDVLDVEILNRPQSPLPATAATVAAENPSARIYNWVLSPGAASAMHTHVRPYLIVAVTGFTLKMTAPDGKSLTHELKRGDFHWVDTKVTHTLANAGTSDGQILEIELK